MIEEVQQLIGDLRSQGEHEDADLVQPLLKEVARFAENATAEHAYGTAQELLAFSDALGIERLEPGQAPTSHHPHLDKIEMLLAHELISISKGNSEAHEVIALAFENDLRHLMIPLGQEV